MAANIGLTSRLQVHGVLQAKRLGTYLAEKHKSFRSIYCSDLQRAKRTAQSILDACVEHTCSTSDSPTLPSLTVLEILREQDFGSLEGKPWSSKAPDVSAPGYTPPETKASMDKRANGFITNYVVPLLAVEPASNVVVVSHGLLLSRLWKCLFARVELNKIHLADNVAVGPRGLEHLGTWSNTGYLELDISLLSGTSENEERGEINPDKEAMHSIENDDGSAREASTEAYPKDSSSTKAGKAENTVTRSPQRHLSHVSPADPRIAIFVHAVNSTSHLSSLKRTRGGIGSAKHDTSQGTIDSFFKRRRTK